MSDDPDGPGKIDFQALAREAATSTYNPRARRCWLLHEWSMWEADESGARQGRRCLRCGKLQRKTLEKTHTHRWTTTETRNLVYQAGDTIPHGQRYYQRCDGCGAVRKVDLM